MITRDYRGLHGVREGYFAVKEKVTLFVKSFY